MWVDKNFFNADRHDRIIEKRFISIVKMPKA
jgi:hypothetical protein